MKKQHVMGKRTASRGVTLTEVLIAIVIVSILAAIAVPSYTNSITKTRRRAAQVCLASLATQMEKYYTTNLRYCVDSTPADGTCDSTTFTLPTLECSNSSNTGKDYSYSATVALSTFTLQAAPRTVQASRDARCGTLSITQAGAKSASGTDGAAGCW